MGEYFAVFRYTEHSKPKSTPNFQAKDADEALETMVRLAGMQSSMSLYEYDLMQIVGRKYHLVGRKFGSPGGTKTAARFVVPETPAPKAPEIPEPLMGCRSHPKVYIERL